jgi:hypothetical protein
VNEIKIQNLIELELYNVEFISKIFEGYEGKDKGEGNSS